MRCLGIAFLKNMTPNDFFCFDGDVGINDGVIEISGEKIGILSPSITVGFSKKKCQWSVSGRSGISRISKLTDENRVRALIESDSICFGDVFSISKCREYLLNPIFSRTVSYLISKGGCCDDVLLAVDRIKKSKILIIGCGGIGGLVAVNLAASGVLSIKILDHDTIDLSNLNRQFFWKLSDIGKYKCNVLKIALNERFPHVAVDVDCRKIDENIIKEIDLKQDVIVISADEPLGVSRTIAKKTDSFVISSGYVGSYLYYSMPSFDHDDDDEWYRNPWFIGPSFGPNNTELAGLVSGLALSKISNPNSFIKRHECSWDSSIFPRNLNNIYHDQ